MSKQKHNKYRDTGIFILRLGFGIMFIYHGFPKVLGGVDEWEKIGSDMNLLGISFLPVFWGFMCAISEFGGGVLFILGLFTRFAAVLMLINMIVAAYSHIAKDHSISGAAHAIEDGIVFLSFIFIGSGRYSLDTLIAG
jgi:putative oxidoreductase